MRLRRRGGYASSDRKVTDLRNPPTGPAPGVSRGRAMSAALDKAIEDAGPAPTREDAALVKAIMRDALRPDDGGVDAAYAVAEAWRLSANNVSEDEVPDAPGDWTAADIVRSIIDEAEHRIERAHAEGEQRGRHREPLRWIEVPGLRVWTHGAWTGEPDRHCTKHPDTGDWWWSDTGWEPTATLTRCGLMHDETGRAPVPPPFEGDPAHLFKPFKPGVDVAPKSSSGVYGGGMTSIIVTHPISPTETTTTDHTNAKSFYVNDKGELNLYDTENGQNGVAVYASGQWLHAAVAENGVVPKHIAARLAEAIATAKAGSGRVDFTLLVDEDGVTALVDDERVVDLDRACEVMHDAYERAAVGEGWETQEASRKPWADVPDANKATMRAAVQALLVHLG